MKPGEAYLLTPGNAQTAILTDTLSLLATLLAAAVLHRLGLAALLGVEAVPVHVLHMYSSSSGSGLGGGPTRHSAPLASRAPRAAGER